jgi:hypothetical protein
MGAKGAHHMLLMTSPPSVSRLSRKCGSPDTSQASGPPRPFTRIALLFFLRKLSGLVQLVVLFSDTLNDPTRLVVAVLLIIARLCLQTSVDV